MLLVPGPVAVHELLLAQQQLPASLPEVCSLQAGRGSKCLQAAAGFPGADAAEFAVGGAVGAPSRSHMQPGP